MVVWHITPPNVKYCPRILFSDIPSVVVAGGGQRVQAVQYTYQKYTWTFTTLIYLLWEVTKWLIL